MGVKDLWQLLAPVGEKKTLWDLQDKVIAVDLSCWVCEGQNIAEHSGQPNFYLRNLFYRTSKLLLLGVKLIFVLEGKAPELKAAVMEQRKIARGFTQSQNTGTQKNSNRSRNHLKSQLKKCCELLKYLGVKCIQSDGEAEALCALLNKYGLVDGCISQDSDCFLYGAQTVYRNLTTATTSNASKGSNYCVDVFNMTSIEASLGLKRNQLIGLSLLCGCDYNQEGVAGVGKENAVKFLKSINDDEVLERLRLWRNDESYEQLELERSVGGCEQCGHLGKKTAHLKKGCSDCRLDVGCTPNYNHKSLAQMKEEKRKALITELAIRQKALAYPDFPNEEIIEEFLKPKIAVPSEIDTKWTQPDIIGFMRFTSVYLKWEEVYAFNKFLPILTRWLLLKDGNRDLSTCPVYPLEIIRTRVLKGTASYEIKWNDKTKLFECIEKACNNGTTDQPMFNTIEPQVLVEKAYPELVRTYNTKKEEERKAKKKGKSKSKSSKTNKEPLEIGDGHEQDKPKRAPKAATIRKHKRPLATVQDEKKQTTLSPFLRKSPPEMDASLDSSLERMLNMSLTLDIEDADLSTVVMSIVGKDKYYESSPESSPSSQSLPESQVQDYHSKDVHFTSTSEDAMSIAGKDKYYENSPQSSPSSQSLPESQVQDSNSEDEFETCIPFLDRIKKKVPIPSDLICSPVNKKAKQTTSESTSTPVSDEPQISNSPRISTSKAARRFSAAFQACTSVSNSNKFDFSVSSSSDPDFDLKFNEFLCDADE